MLPFPFYNCHVSLSGGRPTSYSCITFCMFQPTRTYRSITEIISNPISFHPLFSLVFHSLSLFLFHFIFFSLNSFYMWLSFLPPPPLQVILYFCTEHKHRPQADTQYFKVFAGAFRYLVTGRTAK